jgi:hypothetical protein
MTDVETGRVQQQKDDFANCGRTGRRNALADILDDNVASTTTAGLPLEIHKLQCTG